MTEKRKEIYVLSEDDENNAYYNSLEEILETFDTDAYPIEVDVYELKQKKAKVDTETKIFIRKNKGE